MPAIFKINDMACTGTSLPSSNITCLDYLLTWDLSGAQPIVTITNNSTIINNATLNWWFYVASPSNAPIAGINLNGLTSLPTPNISGMAWTSQTFNLPTPFTNNPCGQIEFSPNSPYTVIVFVQDTAYVTSPLTSFFQLLKSTTLVRPNGNTINTCGNFGVANVSMQVDCLGKVINLFDGTNLSYNNILVPTVTTNKWTLVYPQDSSGNIPTQSLANSPNVSFSASIDSEGYVIYFIEYATYNYGNGISIILQYKLFSESGGTATGLAFALNCNTNLCQLQCQMQEFYQLSKGSAGTLQNDALMDKMTKMNFLYSQVLTGIFQPLCGIDVPALVAEIKKIGNFNDNCNCNCGNGNFGFSNPTGGTSSSNGGCCPVTTAVYGIGTTTSPAGCPNSYFPATIYDPTGVIAIGIANSADDMVSILNSYPAWQTFGIAFNQGNCQVGWYPKTGATIPNIIVNTNTTSTTCVNNTQNYNLPVVDICTGLPISTLSFPMNASVNFGSTSATIEGLGSVSSIAALLTALNEATTKPSVITFSPSSSPSQLNVTVYNTSCSTYNGTITVYGENSSGEIIPVGANHPKGNTASTGGAMEYYLPTESAIGKICGISQQGYQWHTILIGTTMYVSEGNTGRIYMINMSNPIVPILLGAIQLSTIVTGANANFSGNPEIGGLKNYNTLYFITDYMQVDLKYLYVMEGISGTIWQVEPGAPSPISLAFQDNRLIGKCPRVWINNTIYFTQDGNVEVASGQSSGIAAGNIVTLSTSAFGSGGLGEIELYSTSTYYVMAATYDGIGNIYFEISGGEAQLNAAFIIAYNLSTEDITLYNTNQTFGGILKTNIKYSAGRIYTSLYGSGTQYVDVSTLSSTPNYTGFIKFQIDLPGSLVNAANHWNFLPAPNRCYGILTYDTDGTATGAGIAVFDLDGNYLYQIPQNDWQIYNVVLFTGIASPSSASLCPLP